ncbi:hypothetical protein PPEP_a4293 [Pseudoalteromonas peptidolytica F12-50-A1]|uniref:Uncharacterized protein n=1 Tax=Pseudoalteromonas peptidolytica F12-50-A1 TaxID=1315280 RepID=A0A8I0T642_9GAMM|nr:hypothetical protein [Pseudoalteromonas peptidolytica F12-50-A1]
MVGSSLSRLMLYNKLQESFQSSFILVLNAKHYKAGSYNT